MSRLNELMRSYLAGIETISYGKITAIKENLADIELHPLRRDSQDKLIKPAKLYKIPLAFAQGSFKLSHEIGDSVVVLHFKWNSTNALLQEKIGDLETFGLFSLDQAVAIPSLFWDKKAKNFTLSAQKLLSLEAQEIKITGNKLRIGSSSVSVISEIAQALDLLSKDILIVNPANSTATHSPNALLSIEGILEKLRSLS